MNGFRWWDDQMHEMLILFLYLWTLVSSGALTMRIVLEHLV